MPTHVVNTHEAKTRFSELLRLVERGEDVIVARNGTYVAKLIPWPTESPRRKFGSLQGALRYDDADLAGSDPDLQAMFDASADAALG